MPPGRPSGNQLQSKHTAHRLPRYLHIPLVNAERAWAYSLELKREVEAAPAKAAAARRHSVRRLAKAAYWAGELAKLAAARCDTRSALEAEAYASWMKGMLGLEKEADWHVAADDLKRAK